MENTSNMKGSSDSILTKISEQLGVIAGEMKSGAKSTSQNGSSQVASSSEESPEVTAINEESKKRLNTVRQGSTQELKIKKDTAKQLRDIEVEGTDAWEKKNKDMLAGNKAFYDGMATEAAKYADTAGKMMDGIKAFAKAKADEDKREAEDKNEEEKKALKDKYDQGLISKKEYDRGIKASDKNLADAKTKIAEEQARKEKAAAITKIIIETGVAIMKAWSAGPFVAPFLIAAILATSGMQIAAVAKTQTPKARKGGVIVGGSHEQGGVLIEAEGGEAILSRAAMSAFPGVANLMNAAALSGGINDGGYAARSMASGSVEFGNRGGASSSQGIDYERLSSMMSEKMSQTKLFVAVTDINDGQRNYARISDMAKL